MQDIQTSQFIREGFNVTIYTLEKIIYQGKAKTVSSVNEKGTFDILPLHTNFISIIKDKITLGQPGGEKKEFTIKSGVIKAYRNNIYIFLGLEGLG